MNGYYRFIYFAVNGYGMPQLDWLPQETSYCPFLLSLNLCPAMVEIHKIRQLLEIMINKTLQCYICITITTQLLLSSAFNIIQRALLISL